MSDYYDDAYSGLNMEVPIPNWFSSGLDVSSAGTVAPSGYTYDSMGNVVPVGDPSAASADPSGLAEAQNAINAAIRAGNASGITDIIKNFLKTPAGAATGIAGVASLFGLNDPKTGGFKGSIPAYVAKRELLPQPEYVPYTGKTVMGRQFFGPTTYEAPEAPAPAPAPTPAPAPAPAPAEPEVVAADGGLMMAKGRYLRGETDGMADKLNTSIGGVQPARLSHGEFVIPADVVSHLGNGNSDAGAKVLYNMMDKVRKARTGTKKQGKRINPDKFTPGGIASYAQGGTVNFQTGGTTGTGVSSYNPYGTTTQTTLSEWAGPYVANMLGRAQALAGLPYQAYGGPLSAGYSPLQQQYFSGIGALGFPSKLGQSFTGMSTQRDAAGQPMSIAQQYMNPYMQQVLQPQLQAMQRQADIQRNVLGAQAARAGAFGGARSGLMQSQLNADLMRQQQQATGQAYGQAYHQGLGQFNLEQQQAAQLAGLLGGAGNLQRDIEQQGIAALRGQFEEERKYPYAQLQFQQSMLQGLPIGTTSVLPNISPMQQISQAGSQMTNFYDYLTKTFPQTATVPGTTTQTTNPIGSNTATMNP